MGITGTFSLILSWWRSISESGSFFLLFCRLRLWWLICMRTIIIQEYTIELINWCAIFLASITITTNWEAFDCSFKYAINVKFKRFLICPSSGHVDDDVDVNVVVDAFSFPRLFPRRVAFTRHENWFDFVFIFFVFDFDAFESFLLVIFSKRLKLIFSHSSGFLYSGLG